MRFYPTNVFPGKELEIWLNGDYYFYVPSFWFGVYSSKHFYVLFNQGYSREIFVKKFIKMFKTI